MSENNSGTKLSFDFQIRGPQLDPNLCSRLKCGTKRNISSEKVDVAQMALKITSNHRSGSSVRHFRIFASSADHGSNIRPFIVSHFSLANRTCFLHGDLEGSTPRYWYSPHTRRVPVSHTNNASNIETKLCHSNTTHSLWAKKPTRHNAVAPAFTP
ncbi:hypothetical protein EX30DRAFT_348578 [Ascodesmis nigricans]|uniref:Uncharacterized protein n=1 Tax=Ascodesmis nigricans TaxID=341454 RepID=A0A4S2MXN4_9PEZI|nr:hypothetical protein EX30DRAFT_348578 [Ascodesmis nigricans]